MSIGNHCQSHCFEIYDIKYSQIHPNKSKNAQLTLPSSDRYNAQVRFLIFQIPINFRWFSCFLNLAFISTISASFKLFSPYFIVGFSILSNTFSASDSLLNLLNSKAVFERSTSSDRENNSMYDPKEMRGILNRAFSSSSSLTTFFFSSI